MTYRMLISVGLLASITSFAEAASALRIISGEPDARTVLDSTHGWKFKVNTSIVVTHLGLFDDNSDGFKRDYPIDIFNAYEFRLITSGVVHAGVGGTLIDRFRYVDTPDVTLNVGVEYIIAWYTPDVIVPNPSDFHFGNDGEFPTAPEITRTANSLHERSTGGLVFPTLRDGEIIALEQTSSSQCQSPLPQQF